MTKGHRRELEITFLLVGCWIFFMLMLYIDMYIHILTQLLSSVNSYVLGADATPDVSAITPSDAAHVKLLPIFLASSRTGILWRFNIRRGKEGREKGRVWCGQGSIEHWDVIFFLDDWHLTPPAVWCGQRRLRPSEWLTHSWLFLTVVCDS
jgi:hypothetical protein